MFSPILAFRPPNAVHRLPAHSGACPLSARELLGPAGELGLVLPVVEAPIGSVARGALVAAKELRSALGLALPRGPRPGPWFDAVTRAADEVAAGLPIFLSAEVAVRGEGAIAVEHASDEAWALLDAGLTHLAIDVSAVVPAERGRILGEVARSVAERGVGLEVVIPLDDGPDAVSRTAAMLEEAGRLGAVPDAASVRCPAPADDDAARRQAAALARLSQALDGVPVIRRGPITPRMLALLRGSPVKACEDGGAVAARAVRLVPVGLLDPQEETRASPLERGEAELSEEGADRLEASAYVDAVDFIERLGSAGSADSLTRALERRLEER